MWGTESGVQLVLATHFSFAGKPRNARLFHETILAVLEIIHISDTHYGPTRDFRLAGGNTWDRSQALIDAILGLSFVPDLIVHTGDVVTDPHEDSYRHAAEALAALPAPVYYVTGNHDDSAMMNAALSFGPRRLLLPHRLDCQAYQILGAAEACEFLTVDAKVPSEEGPHGAIDEEQKEAVLAAISGTKPVAIFVHFPVFEVGAPWMDAHLLLRDGLDFARKVASASRGHLRGFFAGHLHRGIQLYREGILQSLVGSPACEFSMGPQEDFCDFLPGGPLSFQHISFTAEATMAKTYLVPYPPKA